MALKPLEDRIIVKPGDAEETTASGLVIPDTAKEKPQQGEVIAVGEGRWDDEGPQHRVILTAPYRMGATPVTRAEYAAFDPGHCCPGGDEHPVTEVSWWRAALYAAWVDAALPTVSV